MVKQIVLQLQETTKEAKKENETPLCIRALRRYTNNNQAIKI